MAAVSQAEVIIYEQDTGLSPEANSPFQFKEIIAELPATADDTDTFTVTLADYGITTFKWIKGWAHTTAHSVLVLEAPTTAVSSGVLTVTVGGVTDNLKRTYLIGGV